MLEYIDEIYNKNEEKEREDKRNITKNALVNQIIQANYGNKKYYKIEDVLFRDFTEVFISYEKINVFDCYKIKYGVTTKKPKQPLLKVSKKLGGIELLVPELCLMTGIPDDFDEFKLKNFENTSKNLEVELNNEKYEIENEIRAIEEISQTLKKALKNDVAFV